MNKIIIKKKKDPMPREKSWVWWCMPVIPATAGSIK
jgi:hypothetical protein